MDAAQLEQEKRDADLRAVLNTDAGLRTLRRIVYVAAGLLKDPTGRDAEATSRNIGMQRVGRALLTDIARVSPDKYRELELQRTNMEIAEVLALPASGDSSTG